MNAVRDIFTKRAQVHIRSRSLLERKRLAVYVVLEKGFAFRYVCIYRVYSPICITAKRLQIRSNRRKYINAWNIKLKCKEQDKKENSNKWASNIEI